MTRHVRFAAAAAALLASAVALVAPAAAFAQTPMAYPVGPALEAPRLVVTGQAERYVDPDTCRIYLGVEVEAAELAPARREANLRVRRILEVLRRLHITGMKLKTPSLQVQIIRAEPSPRRLPPIVGYRVRQDFTVVLTGPDPAKLSDNAGKVVDAAILAGANKISGVTFFREADEEIRRELLAEAVRDAITKATAMAEAAGVKLAGFWEIAEQAGYRAVPVQTVMGAYAGAGGGPATALVAGQILIQCTVRVSCRIQ